MKSADQARKLFTELAHPEEFRRLNAARELDRLGYLSFDDPEEPTPLTPTEWREEFLQEPLTLQGGCDALDRAIADWMAPIRRAAAIALGLTGDQAALLPLKKLSRDGDSSVRFAALGALARIDTDESIDFLEVLLRESRDELRADVLTALREATSGDSLSLLWEFAQTSSRDQRLAAIHSLGHHGANSLGEHPYTEITLDVLFKALGDVDERIRAEAVDALHRLNMPECLVALNAAIGDESAAIRDAAARALSRLGVEPTSERALEALDLTPSRLRIGAAKQLRRLADVSKSAALCGALGDLNPEVRHEAQAALTQLRQPETTALLISALDSPYQQVQLGAIRRMGERGDANTIPVLLPFLDLDNFALRREAALSLGKLRANEALPTFHTWLSNTSSYLRMDAVLALKESAWRGSLPLLRKRLRSFGGEPNTEIRRALREAIEWIEAESKERSELPVVASLGESESSVLPNPSSRD